MKATAGESSRWNTDRLHPKWFALYPDLPTQARFVWWAISDFQGSSENGWCFASDATLGALCGMSARQIRTWIAYLKDLGLVEDVVRPGMTTRRRVRLPGDLDSRKSAAVPLRLSASGGSGSLSPGPRQPASAKGGWDGGIDGGRVKGEEPREEQPEVPPPPEAGVDPLLVLAEMRLGTKVDGFLWQLFMDGKERGQVSTVLSWFPGNPSKKKNGQPYWAFIKTFRDFERNWHKMLTQCMEDTGVVG